MIIVSIQSTFLNTLFYLALTEFVLKLENNFTIVDDLHLLDLFKTKSFNEAREYIDNNYRYWAKQYNLENPRTTLDTSMTEMVQRKIKK